MRKRTQGQFGFFYSLKKDFVIAFILAISISTCAAESLFQVITIESDLPEALREEFLTGRLNDEDNFVVMTLYDGSHVQHVELLHPDGLMIHYRKDTEELRLSWFRGDARKIVEFREIGKFQEALSKTDRKGTLKLYNYCLAGSHFGLEEDKWNAIVASIADSGWRFDDQPQLICRCPGDKTPRPSPFIPPSSTLNLR